MVALRCRRGHGVLSDGTRQREGIRTLARRRHLHVQRQGLQCGLRALRAAEGEGPADQGASPTRAPNSRPSLCRISFAPIRPPVGPIGHWFGTRRSWRRPTPTRCALAASAISLRGACGTATAKQMHRASNLADAPAEGCTTACVVHPSAVCARAAKPHAHPLFPSRAARPRGASRSAAGCTSRFCTLHAARTRRRASPSRFAPRTCTPAPSHAPNCDAHSMRPQSRTDFFGRFRTPKNLGGGWPLAGLCSSAARFGWAGQEGGGRQEAGRSVGAGPLPRLDVLAASASGHAHMPRVRRNDARSSLSSATPSLTRG
jgi:hypothetical protein